MSESSFLFSIQGVFRLPNARDLQKIIQFRKAVSFDGTSYNTSFDLMNAALRKISSNLRCRVSQDGHLDLGGQLPMSNPSSVLLIAQAVNYFIENLPAYAHHFHRSRRRTEFTILEMEEACKLNATLTLCACLIMNPARLNAVWYPSQGKISLTTGYFPHFVFRVISNVDYKLSIDRLEFRFHTGLLDSV